jgi:hypothetical protein
MNGDTNRGSSTGHVTLDLPMIGERVVQHVFSHMAHEGAFAGSGSTAPDELIAAAVANWVTGLIKEPDPDGDRAAGSSARSVELASYEVLAERNALLAAALGACDCWGEQPDCPLCQGLGAPGWSRPDRVLFAQYIAPALRARVDRNQRKGERT